MEVKKKRNSNHQLPRSVVPIGFSVPSTETIKTEGFVDELNHLIRHLTARESSRRILPIVGMGGIGKTTLARSEPKSQGRVGDEKLGETLHKCLFNRRYLIILDDIWDSKAWDAIYRFLPDNNNGSRILLTTRLFNVARSVGSCDSYSMKLLDDDNSWDLLSKMVFGQEVCFLELEECGKRIAKSCKGLPLAIVVIGGLLNTFDRTLEYWEHVANNISSIISGEDNECCLEILSLSYHQLPIHLKPCFLYMATYPEDHRIKASDVIKLWAADGFLKPGVDELPEEIAKKYLNDLIDRNLVSVSELDQFGNMMSLTMHDLVRELSIREAQNWGFIHANGASLETTKNQRRLVVHDGRKFSLLGKGYARSLICVGTSYSPNDISYSRLLRVIFASFVPEDIVLVNLRFLRFTMRGVPLWLFSSTISLLWNLETLIVDVFAGRAVTLPCDIWKLRHIKHLVFTEAVILPEPPTSKFVLEKLQTLKKLQNLSDKVLNSITNIKHLEIDNRGAHNHVPIPNMVQCHKLETLNICAPIINLRTQIFPDSIRSLDLKDCEILWGSMTLIGLLPDLQILVIRYNGFKGDEWITGEGEFQSLKYLAIYNNHLVRWRTEECSHFPTLEHLDFHSLFDLEEIPEVFGESMTLKSINLWGGRSNSIGIVRSAKRIWEEQHSNGNDEFTLAINRKLYSQAG